MSQTLPEGTRARVMQGREPRCAVARPFKANVLAEAAPDPYGVALWRDRLSVNTASGFALVVHRHFKTVDPF